MADQYIRVETALRIARQALRDMQYGFSYDDLTVEIENEMYWNSEEFDGD